MGSKPAEWSRHLINAYGLSDKITPDEFIAKCETQYPLFFPKARLLPGVEKLINHLVKHKIPFGISTGSSNEAFRLKATNLGSFFEPFEFILKCGSDEKVKRGKPAPDAFLIAADRFRVRPGLLIILMFHWFFEEISFSRTTSNGTLR